MKVLFAKQTQKIQLHSNVRDLFKICQVAMYSLRRCLNYSL